MADLKTLTAEVVASYIEKNNVAAEDLAALIGRVHGALGALGQTETAELEPTRKLTAAQIRRSISQDALISFEDGKPYRTLKRHLALRGLTPAGYRAKWGLPDDYPVTAPSYSAQRSAMARMVGLGRGGATAASEVPQRHRMQRRRLPKVRICQRLLLPRPSIANRALRERSTRRQHLC